MLRPLVHSEKTFEIGIPEGLRAQSDRGVVT